MRYGLNISAVGPWGNPRTMAELASLAEQSGWDGVFLEDYVFFRDGLDTYDPWITLAAIALATERVTLGTLVTPVPRRRVWKLAAETMTLDHLSGGRVVLGVGSGDPTCEDYRCVREIRDPNSLANALDENLEVLDGLWSGGEVVFRGDHVDIHDVALHPAPVQRPRIPVWVGGCLAFAGPRERALRWDGSCLYGAPPPTWRDLTGEDVRGLKREALEKHGNADFVVSVGGRQRREDITAEVDYVTSLAEAGADWWQEYIDPETDHGVARERIEEGPIRART